jgi:hypothetical protein
MEKQIYQDVVPEEREATLRQNAYEVKHSFPYRRHFSEDEVAEFNKDFVKDSVKLNNLASEYSAEISRMKKELKEKETLLMRTLNIIDRGYEDTEGTVYLFDDQEKGRMYVYDEKGELVDDRMLLPGERQLSIMRKVV